MSRDLKRISVTAIVLLVVLRMCIGWQFLYEGLWKYQTQDTAQPWSAEGYLANAVGPFRGTFRAMAGDPDGLNWLNYQHMVDRWESWSRRFADHYQLDEEQKAELEQLLEGVEGDEFVVRLDRMPEGIYPWGGSLGHVRYRQHPGENGQSHGELYVAKGPARDLGEPQWNRLRSFVTREAEPEYHDALDRLERKISAVGYKQLLAEYLKENPEWTGVVKDADGNVVESHTGKVELYRSRLQQYERELAEADQDYEHEHLKEKWSRIQELKAELVPTVQGLERDMKSAALALLTPEQRKMVPLADAPEPIDTINWITIWSLIVLGVLLIVGLLTRVSAFFGACMVLSFYLVAPPWPGVPVEMGPEHNWIVNKNLIEVVALLALTFLPSGSWFGLDGLFRRLFSQRERARETPPAAKTTPTTPASQPKPATTAAR